MNLLAKLFNLIKSKFIVTQQVAPMQKVYTMYDGRPVSYNAKKASKDNYKNALKNKFISDYAHCYLGLPLSIELESRFIYYTTVQDQCDIDNISKPTIDAFTGYIYNDDKQIIQRLANRHDISSLAAISIDCSNMPIEVATDIYQCIQSNSKHLLICSFAPIDKNKLEKP